MVREAEKSEAINETYIKKVLDYVLLRVRFRYGLKEITHYLLNCMCIRKPHRDGGEMEKKHFLYEKGDHKLGNELDVVNLVRSIRQLRLMAQFLLGQNERMLLKF